MAKVKFFFQFQSWGRLMGLLMVGVSTNMEKGIAIIEGAATADSSWWWTSKVSVVAYFISSGDWA